MQEQVITLLFVRECRSWLFSIRLDVRERERERVSMCVCASVCLRDKENDAAERNEVRVKKIATLD